MNMTRSKFYLIVLLALNIGSFVSILLIKLATPTLLAMLGPWSYYSNHLFLFINVASLVLLFFFSIIWLRRWFQESVFNLTSALLLSALILFAFYSNTLVRRFTVGGSVGSHYEWFLFLANFFPLILIFILFIRGFWLWSKEPEFYFASTLIFGIIFYLNIALIAPSFIESPFYPQGFIAYNWILMFALLLSLIVLLALFILGLWLKFGRKITSRLITLGILISLTALVGTASLFVGGVLLPPKCYPTPCIILD